MKNKNKLLVLFAVIIIISVVSGVSYAYFTAVVKGEGNLNKLTLANFDITFTETQNINVTAGMPIYDEQRATDSYKSKFTVLSNDVDGCLTTKIRVISIQNKFTTDKSLKWELYNVTDNVSLGMGSFEGVSNSEDIILATRVDIPKSVTKEFEVRVWLSYIPDVDQGSLITNNSGNALEAKMVFEGMSGTCASIYD